MLTLLDLIHNGKGGYCTTSCPAAFAISSTAYFRGRVLDLVIEYNSRFNAFSGYSIPCAVNQSCIIGFLELIVGTRYGL